MGAFEVSEDTCVLLVLVTSLASATGNIEDGPRPLTSQEWHKLSQLMYFAGLKSPMELNGVHLSDWGLPEQYTERIKRLLDRVEHLPRALDNLTTKGQWVLGLTDAHYPVKLLKRLSPQLLPPILFGAGEQGQLQNGYLGVVGSRDVDADGAQYAKQLGVCAAESGKVVVSGLARGVDYVAMHSCMTMGGQSIGVLPGNMSRTLLKVEVLRRVRAGQLTLISTVPPDAPFTAWQALSRNKLIYCLSELAVVVAATTGRGGTWSGAAEALRHRWVPLFVRIVAGAPEGNYGLLQKGALPLGAMHSKIIEELSHTNIR